MHKQTDSQGYKGYTVSIYIFDNIGRVRAALQLRYNVL